MLFLGLDIGTTGAKALLIDENGAVHGNGYTGYGLVSNGCLVEQNADDWINCGAKSINKALEGNNIKDIAAVSLSTQGASTVAVDRHNRYIGNAITWMDSRAISEAKTLEKEPGDQYIYQNTGWRINPSLDAAKIMYMKQCDAYASAKRFLSTLEYMNLFLTGNPVCDPTNSAMRQIFNIKTCDYDENILNAINVSRDELPPVLPTGALVGQITSDAAAATGLIQGTPVFNGAHDQYCATIGTGAVHKGDMLLSAGTTWVVMGVGDKPLFTDTYISPGVHPVSGLYGAICSLVGGGASMQWFKNEFLEEGFDVIDRKAAESAITELFYYPYLSGAGYPIWNPAVRGAFTGLSLANNRFDMARAIMEGVAFGVCSTLNDFARNGCSISTLKVMGGATKSALWCSIIAAALNANIEISNETEACALGAAIIAAKGIGKYTDYSKAVAAMSCETRKEKPDAALAEQLADKYVRYTEMWRGIASYYR